MIKIELKKIGVIHSEYKNKKEAPRQGALSSNISTIEIFPQYVKALKRIDELSHIIVLYWGDKSDRNSLESIPPWEKEDKTYGVFSIRSPNRPNPIALCVCKILSVEDNLIKVTGLDALDGSPLLDIKAYAPELDSYPEAMSHKKTQEEKTQENKERKNEKN